MLDLSQIVPNVYVGPCLTSTDEIDDLTAIPITAVLNLQTDDDFNLENIDWPRLAEHYRQPCRSPSIRTPSESSTCRSIPKAAGFLLGGRSCGDRRRCRSWAS